MADGYISQIKTPDNKVYDFRDQHLKVYTGSCTTSAATAIKDVITDGEFVLAKGAVVFVNFSATNSAAVGNLKLKFNGEADTNAKPIKYLVNGNDPANIPGAGYLRANQTYMFQYDGTNWVAVLNYYTYSNNFASMVGHYNNILARKDITAESLIVGDSTGYEKVASGVTFDLAYPIVWCTKNIDANTSNYANMYLQHYDRNIATGAKPGFTSTANKVIYLIVTINGNIATIDSNIITDTLPSSDDGKVYISLGKLGAQSTGANYFFLYPVHPMFWYKDGAIREYNSRGINNITRSGTTFTATRDDGSTFTFTQQDNNTTYSAGTGLSLSDTTFNHSNSITAKTSYADTATTASANGGKIKVTDIKYDAQGHVTGSQDRTITLSQVTSYLPLAGGIMTGNIRRYYSTASTEPMITMLSNNQDIILWEAGHGTAAATTTTSNHYKLLYRGTGQDSDNSNQLRLIAHKTDDIIAIQIDEIGKITLPQMATGDSKTPIYINNNGVITAGDALKDLAYISKGSGTTKFLREDGTWQTALTAHRTYTAVSGKKPAGNQTPGFGKTFDIEQVDQDATGQVSVAEWTVKIPDTAASVSTAGLVNTSAQSFAGIKTFYDHYTNGHIASSTGTGGRYAIIRCTNKGAWMTSFHVRMYTSYESYTLEISGYNYNINNWYSPKAIMVASTSTSKVTVTFGYDDDATNNYKTLWVAIPIGSYPGIDVQSVVTGHTDTQPRFSVTIESEVPTTVQTTIDAYRPWYRNETVTNATNASAATTATKFASAQSITLTGDVTGTASSQAGWSLATTIGTGKVTNAMLAGSINNDKLANSKVIIAGNEVSLGGSLSDSKLRESLGLSKALRFIGVTTTDMTGGTAANHSWTGTPAGISDYTPKQGDVVINSTKQDEWVCTTVSGTTYTWERLGSDTSYKIVQSTVSDPTASTATSTTFIDTISQNANGVITATKKTLPTATNAVAGITTVGASGGAAAYNHTHTLSIAENTGTNAITLAYGKTYKLTAGGSTYIFAMPASDNVNTATAADNILDGSNSGTEITYAPYATQQSKLSFDVSSTNPTRADRLNLNGYLYATKYFSSLTQSSWIDGQRHQNGALNIADYSNTNYYNPWIRATNTWASGKESEKVGRWFSFGTLGTSFYLMGSASTRTENSYDNALRYDTSNGYLYAAAFKGKADSAGAADTAGKWTTARTFTIGNEGHTVDGSGNITWSLEDIGAATSGHKHGEITNGGLLNTASMAVVTDSSNKITTADLSVEVDDFNTSANAATTFVQAVTQDSQGKIRVITAPLNTTGEWSGNAVTATDIQTEGTTAQFYRGDNAWSNILKQTAASALVIDNNYKIGTAIKDLHFSVGYGSGAGINDGNAGGITIGSDNASYGGIYWQSSGSYGLRLHFATTNSFANGAYTRMLIAPDGKVGIGTLTPDTNALLTVNGNTKAEKFIGPLQGNANTATKWASAQSVYVDLETPSTTTTIQGGSSTAQTIGVDGTLGIGNGGTGVTSFTKNQVILSDNTNGITGLTSRAYSDSDSTSAGALSNTSINFVTERYVYYTRPSFNNTHDYDFDSTYYAPTTGGAAGYILIGKTTTTAPVWYGGTVMSGSAAGTWKTEFKGTTNATATNAAAVTIAGGLGIGKKLYVGETVTIGNTDEYGDAYTPIYWHNGVPTVVTLTQQCAFTIKSGMIGVKLSHAAITINSYVTQIVIDDGEENLNSAISWTSADGYIELRCSKVSGNVTGYIMISRGGGITATATDITPTT